MSSAAPAKSKAELKAERRAIQEAQRAAKAASKSPQSSGPSGSKQPAQPVNMAKKKEGKPQNSATNKMGDGKQKQQNSADLTKGQQRQRSGSFRQSESHHSHIKKVDSNVGAQAKVLLDSGVPHPSPVIHPAFLELALQSGNGTIVGSDARCVALISAFKKFIMDYKKPDDKAFGRDIETAMRPHISYLSGGSPLPPSIGNLVKQLKHQMLTHLPNEVSDEEGKTELCEWLVDFVREKIELAFEAISLNIREKLTERPVVMTYSWCPIIEKILIDAKKHGLEFRVVIIDSVPEQSGKNLLRNLLKWEIECSYALLNSLSYAIRECRLVLIGADALLANGSFVGHLGTSQVALVAQAHNVPVLAVCPTYKFAEKVQTGTPEHEADSVLSPEASEMIPADLVSGVVTELRILPPSSVPAVLRVKQIL